LKRYAEALEYFQKALSINPHYAEAYFNYGNALYELKRYEEAISAFQKALHIQPLYLDALINCGNGLCDLKRYDEGIASYQKALAINPNSAEAYNNLGHAFNDLKRYEEAVGAFKKALQINPHYVEAYNNLGNTLFELKRHEDAIAVFKKVLSLNPHHAPSYFNLGNAYFERKRYEEAVAAYTRATEIKKDYDSAVALKWNIQSLICDWSEHAEEQKKFSHVGLRDACVSPFAMFHLEDNPSHHKMRAECYTQKKTNRIALSFLPKTRNQKDRLRIGYFSPDFREHIVGRLVLKLFEAHDRSRFEIFAYSYGPPTQDLQQTRIRDAVDVFRDVMSFNDLEITQLARKDEIDIAVDLTGYTQLSRASIFAYRAAPLQINYLGYPGTMGAPFMDYLIADTFVIPETHRHYYTEKIISLPHQYLVCDATQQISEKTMTRSEMGLPEKSFVFCCFNNVYKIRPEEFGIWMRLLQKCDDSVLWLPKPNASAEENLRKEAALRGVNPNRLIFAGYVSLPDYLKRYQLADLFLDTFHFNAHSTAADVLWSGLPLLTKAGQGFAARVAGSLLKTLGLPELVTSSAEAYEATAYELASNRSKLDTLKQKLLRHKKTSPLFDTPLFTKHLEAAYTQAYQLLTEGQKIESFEVIDLRLQEEYASS
ncbi:MAG: tetratricopeptide repeat protein, partial [Hyphomicrobium sp.]